MHTWFYRDRDLYEEEASIEQRIDDHRMERSYLDSTELYQAESRAQELHKLNDPDSYHDCFRISKREADGTYCEDVIYSRKKCKKWLEDNKEFVHDLNQKQVDEFWDEFPNGVIDFG